MSYQGLHCGYYRKLQHLVDKFYDSCVFFSGGDQSLKNFRTDVCQARNCALRSELNTGSKVTFVAD
jgi:hypothetical protein